MIEMISFSSFNSIDALLSCCENVSINSDVLLYSFSGRRGYKDLVHQM